MIRIIFIRHGHTAWNADEGRGKRLRGIIDLPLAEEGVAQARATARRLAQVPLAAIYASPLQRAVRTAESMDYGDWAGKFHSEVAEGWPDLFRRWHHDPFSIQIPGGESPGDLRDRAVAALHQALQTHDDGDTIAVVSHQVVTKTLICALARLPNPVFWHIRQDLCNLSCFDYQPSDGTFTLVSLNDTCHLDPALPRTASEGTRIVLIRHGQTAWNVGANAGAAQERFRGRTDLPLDDTGQAQARAVADRLKSEPIVAIYASPLLRTRQTAAPLARERGLAVRPHDGLLDIDYGRFQGLSHAEAAQIHPDLYAQWRATPAQVRFPGGESLADVQARLLALLDEMAITHPGQTVALVGHQMVNKTLTCTLLDLDLNQVWRLDQDTAGLNVFAHPDQAIAGTWHTLRLNDTCHLRSMPTA
jgi:broad specificity phosphatase PhoE